LGFSATVGFSIAGRTLLRLLLPMLGVGAFVTTIALPVVSAGTCIYYGVKIIKNRKKAIKLRKQKDL
jgi:TRAP-type C4-dicarboxylate transport system permease small subunit